MRFAFRNFPLTQHAQALPCAIAAETSREMGRFWEAHDALYALNSSITPAHVAATLSRLKVDVVHVSASQRKQAVARVNADLALAAKLHLDATPSFILCCPDGRVLLLGDISQVEAQL